MTSELARFDPDTGEVYAEPPIVPVADARPSWHEAGRIRVGVKVPIPGRPGKFRPAKLTRFRLTSAKQILIDRAAELWGGTPELWEDAPTADDDGEGQQWQVTTRVSSLAVRIPPAAAASQKWESWSGGGCERRCDGNWEENTDSPCICKAEAELAIERGGVYERPCRKTTRVSVMLDDLPGAGIWRFETKSTISGDELATWLRIVFPYLPPMAPLVLQVEKVKRKRRIPDPSQPRGWDWQTFVFPLVSIDTRDQTIGQLLAQRPAVAAPPPVTEVAGRVAEQASDPGSAAHPPRPTPGSDPTSEAETPGEREPGSPRSRPGAGRSGGLGPSASDPTSEAEAAPRGSRQSRVEAAGPPASDPNASAPDPGGNDATQAGRSDPSGVEATISPATRGGETDVTAQTSPTSPGDGKAGRGRGGRRGSGNAPAAADPPPAEPAQAEEAEQAAFEQALAGDDPGTWAR